MTDGEIARQIKEEFDHIPEIKNKFSNRNPDLTYMMSKYRSEYNRGRLVPSKAPPEDKYVSFLLQRRWRCCESSFYHSEDFN
jgi:hypothetical protein